MKVVMKPKEYVRLLDGKKEAFTLECEAVAFLLFEDINCVRTPILVNSFSSEAFSVLEKQLLQNISDAGKGGNFKAIGSPGFVAALSSWVAKKNWKVSNSVLRKGKFEVAYEAVSGKLRVSKESVEVVKNSKVKVLIVDDSPTIRNILKQVFQVDPDLEIVAMAETPSQVEDLIVKHKPDVMTLDIHMPEMTGVELLRKLMPKYHIPTVMISSISKEEGPEVLEALSIGAIDYIQKPSLEGLDQVAKEMRESIKNAAKANVARPLAVKTFSSDTFDRKDMLIAIGSSTGGTEALKVLFECLPQEIPPVLVVQHIPAVFSKALAERLNDLCPFEVKEAVDGDAVKSNRVLIAPGGKQMSVIPSAKGLVVKINDDAPVNRHKPSVDYMFDSLTKLENQEVFAVILTGMGADGARGMKALHSLGARTIAQDKETSVVYGMPREAVALGAAEHELPLHKIAAKLAQFSKEKKTKLAG